MKRIIYLFTIAVMALSLQSCDPDEPIKASFEDMIDQTVYDYIADNDSLYSKFLSILKAGNLDKTMSAYNPNGNGYTMFLPTNAAIDQFIEESPRFSTFEELLADKEYVAAMARFHVVNMGIITNDFPFGALPELNLAGQYLTIGFEMGIYKVNNLAPVTEKNIEVSNGYIHIISLALEPVTFTTFKWLKQNPQFSIFAQAVEATGFNETLNRIILRDTVSLNPVTLLVEPDSIYNKNKIFNFDDLVKRISPNSSDYTDEYNPLYNFVGYHILSGSLFLSDFEEESTNYTTFGNNPVQINGKNIDLEIHSKDTLVTLTNDTTFVDYVTFLYDLSNLLTQSGTVHFVNELMLPKQAARAELSFEFYEEQLFNQYREEGGEFLVEDPAMLSSITWTGGNDQLVFVKSEDESNTAWNKDYLVMEGDFSISYTLPPIVQGNYNLSIRANAYSGDNALVEVFFDGVKVGGLVDLTTGGSSSYPYIDVELGTVSLINYEPHVVTVRSLIPGYFYWDVVRFEPI